MPVHFPSRFRFCAARPAITRQARNLATATAAVCLLLTTTASAQNSAPAGKPLDQSFPEKVATFSRTAVNKTAPVAAGATDAATAKYDAPSGEISWTAMTFATPEEAMSALDSTIAGLTKQGAKVSTGINNAEGKVRFAMLETKQGPTYCWVNKKEKTIMYMVTGRAPDLSKFIEMQTTW